MRVCCTPKGMMHIYNFDKEIAKYGLTTEQYEEILKECSAKQNHTNDKDWAEIISSYNIKSPNVKDAFLHYDSLRKAQQTIFGGAFVYEYYRNKNAGGNETYLDELRREKEDIQKERYKFYDQRREYNKNIRNDARSDYMAESLVKAAQKLNEMTPINCPVYVGDYSDREACVFFADWHYGMVTDNIWNKYNIEICTKRVEQVVKECVRYLELFKPKRLHVCLLGDFCAGAIHNSCRVASEEDVCDQLMQVSEILAQAINHFSKYTDNVCVYSAYGNHMRTVQNKEDSIHTDNMEKIIPWWLKRRLSENNRVVFIDSPYNEFVRIEICGHNVLCVHGDLEKDFKQFGVKTHTLFSKKFGFNVDYVVSADKHHLEEFEGYGVESVIIRSLCGTDNYANDKRLYSYAGQTMMIFNESEGRECTRNIIFKE